ncbi:hypothetical protein T10_7487 [Trichinella papuae]|uniref:Uncharacterized protein n=1 Tax=Trichinella papuae TaxID=268474 RepID=A0A0V1MEN5_9BILA|nr:hypothetical protein T10_7487 [Trichinella papuae]
MERQFQQPLTVDISRGHTLAIEATRLGQNQSVEDPPTHSTVCTKTRQSQHHHLVLLLAELVP